MSVVNIFRLHLVFGYLAWAMCFATYVWPSLSRRERVDAHRMIATLHSFRFFGLVFLLPGVVGPDLPPTFAESAAYGDFATSILAILALLTFKRKPLFWIFVWSFNLVGTFDLLLDTYHAVTLQIPATAGQFGAAYAIPVLYVPLLMITHAAAYVILLRGRPIAGRIAHATL